MKYKRLFFFSLCLSIVASIAMQAKNLEGFYYGDIKYPQEHEWQSVDSLAYNKEQPRAIFWSFQDLESAKKVLPENSKYWLSLDGKWKFNWVPEPSQRPLDFYKNGFDTSYWDEIEVPSNWNIAGLQKDGTKKYGTPIYVNQPVIFYHEIKPDDWRKGVMRTPPTDWTTYKDRNEVGSYKRTFTIPKDWKDREVFINFDGVDSFFYLWINENYVGFSKNSRNAAAFNITKYLKQGENSVSVEVYRNSDGSFLESQDMFRLPGIFRSVSLYSTPKVQIRDMKIIPDLSQDYKDGKLSVTATVRNLSSKNVNGYKIEYHLFANKLYSDDHENYINREFRSSSFEVAKSKETEINSEINVENPNKWSAEQPYRYTLTASLIDNHGKVVETVSTYIGFRKVEILDTPAEDDEFGLAGRYFYVNGQPVKLKGVNRHETTPETGHTVSRERMTEEVMMMKRANINHVRHSHYPDNPYWYYLAEKFGLYLEDEANLESHEYYYGDASLSHVPEWRNAHVARNMEMVHARVNSPAVVIWSLGNEAGPGENFEYAYQAIKEFDTSRPVQYERNNWIVDMGSNQYPSIPWVQEAVKGEMDIKYPFHISEYAHSMGNAVGNLVDYWNAIESTNHFMGGAIWDWIDQSLYNYDAETGEQYLAFGGDFGDNPTDGQFVMNGILFGDLTPKPQYYEVKKVYQNVAFSPLDITRGEIEIFNKNYFSNMGDYELEWNLIEDGLPIQTGKISDEILSEITPRTKKSIVIPFDSTSLDSNKEYFMNLYLKLKENKPWAEAGFIQMEEQLPVKNALNKTIVPYQTLGSIDCKENGDLLILKCDNFTAEFNQKTGVLCHLKYGDSVIIENGEEGLQPDFFRAYLNNDNWIADQWFSNGLYNLNHKVISWGYKHEDNGNIIISSAVECQAPYGGKMRGGNGNASGVYSIEDNKDKPFGPDDFKIIINQVWTVFPDGVIALNSYIDSNKPGITLPRLGYSFRVPSKFDNIEYYGRGPEENYADRKTGQFIGRYRTTPEKMFTNYTRPQSNGNREEVRWANLTNDKGEGILISCPQKMSFTAIPYSEMDLFLTNHPYKLEKSNSFIVHIDAGVTGLGGASCGQGGPLDQDRMKANGVRFGFILSPFHESIEPVRNVVIENISSPIGISRDMTGLISIDAPKGKEVLYSINSSTPQIYEKEFIFKEAGNIKAYLKDEPLICAALEFPKIEVIPSEVVYASSQEPDYGDASHLVDGNPGSIWHTMYSVTVAQFPHWVDFDTKETNKISGVEYLPRQDDNSVGIVKDYEIYVSETPDFSGLLPVAKGSFTSDRENKRVDFKEPVKGRYVRFKALNAHDGREYATGAEFKIISE